MRKIIATLLVVSLIGFSGSGQTFANPPKKVEIVINGKRIDMLVPPVIIKGYSLVPIRVISEALGYNVKWDRYNHRLTITTSVSTIPFPEKLSLSYSPLAMEKVTEIKEIPAGWKKRSSLKVGIIDQTKIVMDLYELKKDVVPAVNGVFHYDNRMYVLEELNQGTIDEVENVELNLVIGTEPSAHHVVSAIGVGYGTKLLVFDQNAGQWLTTALSGKPVTEFESGLLVQFPGKGLNTHNVSSIRYMKGSWEIEEVNHAFRQFQDQIEISRERFGTIYRQGQILVYVTKAGSSMEAAYSLDNNGSELKRIHK